MVFNMPIPTSQELLVRTLTEECCPGCKKILKESGVFWHAFKDTGAIPAKDIFVFDCPCGRSAIVKLTPYYATQLNYNIEWVDSSSEGAEY